MTQVVDLIHKAFDKTIVLLWLVSMNKNMHQPAEREFMAKIQRLESMLLKWWTVRYVTAIRVARRIDQQQATLDDVRSRVGPETPFFENSENISGRRA